MEILHELNQNRKMKLLTFLLAILATCTTSAQLVKIETNSQMLQYIDLKGNVIKQEGVTSGSFSWELDLSLKEFKMKNSDGTISVLSLDDGGVLGEFEGYPKRIENEVRDNTGKIKYMIFYDEGQLIRDLKLPAADHTRRTIWYISSLEIDYEWDYK